MVRIFFSGEKTFVIKMEVRDVDRLLRRVPAEHFGWVDTVKGLASSVREWEDMQRGLKNRSYGFPESEIFEAVLQCSPGLSSVMEPVKKFVDEGHTDRAHKAHRVKLSLQEARKSIERAFRAGATREHINELMDELLVKEVMEA